MGGVREFRTLLVIMANVQPGRLAYRWPVRSPESSTAPATVCPIVTARGFAETPTAQRQRQGQNSISSGAHDP